MSDINCPTFVSSHVSLTLSVFSNKCFGSILFQVEQEPLHEFNKNRMSGINCSTFLSSHVSLTLCLLSSAINVSGVSCVSSRTRQPLHVVVVPSKTTFSIQYSYLQTFTLSVFVNICFGSILVQVEQEPSNVSSFCRMVEKLFCPVILILNGRKHRQKSHVDRSCSCLKW
jgi:hypothetical protein